MIFFVTFTSKTPAASSSTAPLYLFSCSRRRRSTSRLFSIASENGAFCGTAKEMPEELRSGPGLAIRTRTGSPSLSSRRRTSTFIQLSIPQRGKTKLKQSCILSMLRMFSRLPATSRQAVKAGSGSKRLFSLLKAEYLSVCLMISERTGSSSLSNSNS